MHEPEFQMIPISSTPFHTAHFMDLIFEGFSSPSVFLLAPALLICEISIWNWYERRY